LKAGAPYKLIARTKNGDKMVAGTVLTTAPNTRVAIMVREDLVNSSTPPLPAAAPPAAAEGINKNDKGAAKAAPKMPWDPLFGLGKKPAQEPNLPATLNVPAPPGGRTPGAGEPAFIPGIGELPKDRPPFLKMPNPTPRAPGDVRLDTGPTRVPSCVLVGNHLENFAVKDSKGQTWEYKKQAAGKLVLLDFWGTYCVHCQESMPALNRLQQQYGQRGLEVIGIALEGGKDEKREADAVNKFCSARQLSYRQLMGRAGSFDLGKQFSIKGVPTLILLSDQGDIIETHLGRPDPDFFRSLERTIQAYLGKRSS
jgi:thiol-disulfide isomerase/thioredoxin